jgi:hypothetical protein
MATCVAGEMVCPSGVSVNPIPITSGAMQRRYVCNHSRAPRHWKLFNGYPCRKSAAGPRPCSTQATRLIGREAKRRERWYQAAPIRSGCLANPCRLSASTVVAAEESLRKPLRFMQPVWRAAAAGARAAPRLIQRHS